MKNKILLFLKGILMGICDLIPGISGGTIAFITGIYVRLINAVKAFSLKLVYDLITFNKKELKQDIKKLDLGFLFTLFLGIMVAILAGSRIIKFLLENYFAYTLSFFIGLILASSKIIFDNIKNHKMKNILFGILGLIFGVLISFLVPKTITPTLFYVFIGGFVAISALFLPGISGAFILLIMGLYEFIIEFLHDIFGNINYLIVFGLGAILGAFTISRIISFLFKKDKCKTLYFLLGLVIGAVSIPIKKIIEITSFNASNSFIMLGLFLGSILIVLVVSHYGKIYERKLQKVEDKIEKEMGEEI
tara:strand:+ start:44 stop:958 length:915 start_codon:yes stop_codon:yes gene_type:complete